MGDFGVSSAICVLHDGEISRNSGIIKLFTEKSLEKCSKVLQIRKLNNYKFSDVNLPNTVDKFSGYHSACYRAFTAVAKNIIVPSIAENDESGKY